MNNSSDNPDEWSKGLLRANFKSKSREVDDLKELLRDMSEFISTTVDSLSQYELTKGVSKILVNRINEKKIISRVSYHLGEV